MRNLLVALIVTLSITSVAGSAQQMIISALYLDSIEWLKPAWWLIGLSISILANYLLFFWIFWRLIDYLHPGPDPHLREKRFNIWRIHTHTAGADPQTHAVGGAGAMNKVFAITHPQAQCKAPQRVIRPCRYHRGQFYSLRQRACSDAWRWGPGWIRDLLANPRGGDGRFQPQLADPQRIDLHTILPWREIIESQLGDTAQSYLPPGPESPWRSSDDLVSEP
jgi:hypothetical protein